jgi:hypothetical protein
MVWTAVVAVILAIARAVVPDDFFDGSGNAAKTMGVVALLAVFNSLAAWPMIWAAFVRSDVVVWCGVAVMCSAILCFFEVLGFRAVVGRGVDAEVFIVLHLIQLLAVGSSLLLVRLNGIRLVRAADMK